MGSKKRRGNVLAIVIVVLVIAAVAAFILRSTDSGKTTIRVTHPKRGTVSSTVTATGTLQPLTTVQVKSNVGGTVIKLAVNEGQLVKKNQLIALIDPSDSLTALQQAQADLAASNSKVAQSRDQLALTNRQNRAALKSAEQAVHAAQLKYLQAQEQAKLQKHTTINAIAQAEQALSSAKAQLAQSNAHLAQAIELARVQPTLTNAAIDQAKSNLANAQAALEQTKSATIPQALAGAKADYDQARANHDYAQTNLKRQQQLFEKGFVAKGTVDTAVQAEKVASAALASVQSKFDTATKQTDEDLHQAQTKVDQANAALANAMANRSQDTQRQQDVDSAKAAVQQNEAGVHQAEANLQFARENSVQDKLKEQDVDAANTAWQQAKAALETAVANLLQDNINRSNIVQANATVEHNKAAVKSAQTNFGYTTILAPSDGVILKKWSDVGTIVTAGRSSVSGSGEGVSIVDMADTSRMFALVNVDETDIAQVSLHEKVDITLDAYPDEMFEGKVTEIAPESTVVQNVTTIPVTVEIDMPDQRLKSGMNVTCEFITDRKTDVLMVPNEAVKDGDDGGSTVQVLVGDKPVTRKVEIGLAGNDMTEIVSGVTENDRVITSISEPKKAGSGFTPPPGGMGGPMGGGGGGGMRGMSGGGGRGR